VNGLEVDAVGPGHDAGAVRLERHRAELIGYCYRMLGSVFEAEDAVQETMVRAWRSLDRFEERSSLRSWVYRIATNVCLDALAAGKRRARPMDLSGPTGGATSPGIPLDVGLWIEPCPAPLTRTADNPAEAAEVGESVRLAFIAALQHLPSKQRATLLLKKARVQSTISSPCDWTVPRSTNCSTNHCLRASSATSTKTSPISASVLRHSLSASS
jgi:RNA polymerase sigma-70 factor (TIGR02960 family)